MDQRTWPAEWLRGVLELGALGVLARGKTYGYLIAQALEEAGLGAVKGGTLYPLLGRLERDGFVTSSWEAGDGGPGRKYLQLTPEGHEELRRRSAQWHEFVAGAARLIPAPTPAQPATGSLPAPTSGGEAP